ASRYLLREGGREEAQVSSGFWVGTPAGSTGAIHSAGGRVLPLTAEKLQLVVREPLVSRGAPLRMTRLVVGRESPVVAVSKMRDACLFLDGPFIRAPVRLGDRVTFSLSREPLLLLGVASRRGRGAR
ncbi:MAG: NAD(+) kinase, partial [Deltaproteobacteria bacterium]|nr:NAD(+) kinase [Deltaproteobacteria bacterium]